MSPEIVSKRDYCGKQSDVWALGIMLFSLLYGRCPFRGENEKDLYRKIAKGVFAFPDETYPRPSEFTDIRVSQGAKNLVKKLLVVSAEKRLSCADILKDEWFKNREV